MLLNQFNLQTYLLRGSYLPACSHWPAHNQSPGSNWLAAALHMLQTLVCSCSFLWQLFISMLSLRPDSICTDIREKQKQEGLAKWKDQSPVASLWFLIWHIDSESSRCETRRRYQCITCTCSELQWPGRRVTVSRRITPLTFTAGGGTRPGGLCVCLLVRLSAVCINGVHDPWASRQSWVKGRSGACLGFLAAPTPAAQTHTSTHTQPGGWGGVGCTPTRLISPLGFSSRQN